jgi:hypothetical protein
MRVPDLCSLNIAACHCSLLQQTADVAELSRNGFELGWKRGLAHSDATATSTRCGWASPQPRSVPDVILELI